MSTQQIIDKGWSALPDWAKVPYVGIDKQTFANEITEAINGGGYTLSTSNTNAVDNNVIVKAYTDKGGKHDTALNATLTNLNNAGYYVVSLAPQTIVQPLKPIQPTVSSSSSGGFWNAFNAIPKTIQDTLTNIASNTQPVNATASGSPVQNPMQPTGGGGKRQLDNPIVYQSRTKKLSAVEKKRLLWIILIGGGLFAVTLGIVASRD
jgi:hypothetical protein